MKVIIPKQILKGQLLTKKSKKPFNLYGVIRENEGLIHIFSISQNDTNLPLIGQISNDKNEIPDNLKLKGIIKKNLVFYYEDDGKRQKIKHLIIDLNDSLKRMPFPQKLMKIFKNASVVIFGLGTGGSRLAVGLARSGVSNFKLIDPDLLSIENISRHECDLLDLNRFKVHAVKDKILRVNPFANVRTFNFDVFKKPSILDDIFRNSNLVIGATDKTSVQLMINYESYQRGITALFGGCYEEAKGGEIMFIIPGKTIACLECWEGGRTCPKKLGKIDYSNATGPEDYKGEPGLNAAINLITDVAEQYAIALLLRNEDCEMAKLIDPKRNLLLIGGALGKGYYLFEKPFHFILPILKGPWAKCGTCQ